MTSKYILFDLDGTLTNPKEGITKSLQYALKHMGHEVEDLETLVKHIGPPLTVGLQEFWGMNDEEIVEATKWYREYFADKGIYQNEKYEGIDELLQTLKENGKKLYVATSKPEKFAKLILEHFHLDHYFIDICGASMDGKRAAKGDVIRYALLKNKIEELNEVVMIGDRLHDIVGAKDNNIRCIAVLYGFGNEKEFKEYKADAIAKDIQELEKILLND